MKSEIPLGQIRVAWNEMAEKYLPPGRKMYAWSSVRLSKTKSRWAEWARVEESNGDAWVTYRVILKQIASSRFLRGLVPRSDGKDKPPWAIDYSWLVSNETHWQKVYGGLYNRDGDFPKPPAVTDWADKYLHMHNHDE